jgi:predicted TIM-barrel fold metal-dependent hydrolase
MEHGVQSSKQREGRTAAMRVIDVDSHFLEPVDWLHSVNPRLAGELPPPPTEERVVQAAVGDLLEVIPRSQRPDNILDLLAPTGRRSFLAMLEQAKSQDADLFKVPPAGYDAEARLALMDRNGIDIQFLNPTLATGAFAAAQSIRRPDLAREALAAFNSWGLGVCHGHTDRLLPIALIDLADPDWALAEMRRVREGGSRAVQIRPAPVNGTDGRTRSLSHPDFDRLWSAAEDLGLAIVFHIGGARSSLDHGWFHNGGEPSNYAMLHFLSGQMTPQIALAALILDGVLERHPRLVVMVQELGVGWVPHFLEVLDSVTVGPYGDQFGIGRDNWRYPLTPSEYVRRQVRFTPLVSADPLRPTFDRLPPELLVFSSDFPHVEGRIGAVGLFENQLDGIDAAARAGFFGGSIGALMGL